MQLRELREYAHRRELQIVEEYIDSGISGSKDSRPALNRLMVDVHSRKFDAVLVWKIDRWGGGMEVGGACSLRRHQVVIFKPWRNSSRSVSKSYGLR